MHAGFAALRGQLPMNVRRTVKAHSVDDAARRDIARIAALWSECRSRFGTGGPFLYGAFGAADAMYAPVIWRFHTYAVEVSAAARAYMRALMELPAWNEWRTAALQEPWVMPRNEIG
jgi:glutathione S-transferase